MVKAEEVVSLNLPLTKINNINNKHLQLKKNMKFNIFLCLVQCMSVVPLEIFRWMVAGVAGFMSATFVALNLRAHIMSAGERWVLIVASIFVLQLALAVALKVCLFTVTV